jgi:hypothetical protein
MDSDLLSPLLSLDAGLMNGISQSLFVGLTFPQFTRHARRDFSVASVGMGLSKHAGAGL